MSEHQEQPLLWLKARTDLQQRINRVKVMLWASDYGSARQQLQEIDTLYGSFLWDSFEVKARLTKIYRENKRNIEDKYRQRGLRGRDLGHQVQEDIAGLLHLDGEEEDALYLLSPIASVVRRLNRRVVHEPNEPLPVHDASGFSVMVTSYGQYQWEIRAYRFKPPPLDVYALLVNFKKHLEDRLFPVEEDTNSFDWPLWLRAFLTYAFLEIRFYSPGRFAVSITGNRETDIDHLLSTIMEAVVSAQGTSSKAST